MYHSRQSHPAIPPMFQQTVYVVDDEEVIRVLLSELLGAHGYHVRTFESAEAFLEALHPEWQGCLLLDMVLPGMSGMALQEALAQRAFSMPIVFVSGQGDIPSTVRAMRHGADDFLTKPVVGEELLRAVAHALARDREARQAAAERQASLARLATLSAREREILYMALAGLQNKEIARELGLSHRTVEAHRSRVLLKLGVDSVIAAMRLVNAAEASSCAPAMAAGARSQ